MKELINPSRTALVLVDVQNDFFHADGALRRSGVDLAANRSFVESLMRLCDGAREAGLLLIGSSFTLIADTQNDALVPRFLHDLGVKLLRGDFQVSKWGHQLIEEVLPVHYIVDKTGPSAFFRTELDLILRHRDIDTVIVAGLNATRSVVATAYDALSLGLQPIIASDGSADYDAKASEQLMGALGSVFDIRSVREVLDALTVEKVSVQGDSAIG